MGLDSGRGIGNLRAGAGAVLHALFFCVKEKLMSVSKTEFEAFRRALKAASDALRLELEQLRKDCSARRPDSDTSDSRTNSEDAAANAPPPDKNSDIEHCVSGAIVGTGCDDKDDAFIPFDMSLSVDDISILCLALLRLEMAADTYIQTAGECEADTFFHLDRQGYADLNFLAVLQLHRRAGDLRLLFVKLRRQIIDFSADKVLEKTSR